ncbi:ion transporter [Cyclobacterium salsum]|uniref:ion transporter n=1 Tax=Cyclobacterium salsum TaxID=2666329 RepID=UPI0013914FB1|nr:ion transporter [Cyclobacterium salsum]
MNQKQKDRKASLLAAIDRCENPYLLARIEALLKRDTLLQPIGELSKNYPSLLQIHSKRDLSVQTHLASKNQSKLLHYQELTAAPLFFTSLLMLLITAAILNNFSIGEEGIQLNPFLSKLAIVYSIGWLLYLLDFLIIIFLSVKSDTRIALNAFIPKVLSLLFPPLGLGLRHLVEPQKTWLPFYHWSLCNEGLLNRLKQQFSIPMIIIALLILPVVIIEWQFYEEVEAFLNTDLSFVLDMVQGFIWLAFALEFILLISITPDRLTYIKKNWIDLLIILLPFISFVRTLRIFKVARLTHLVRGYKLRALLMKARQGFIFASFFYRLLAIKPDFQIKKLKKKLDQNQAEREIIEEDLAKFAAWVQQKKRNL